MARYASSSSGATIKLIQRGIISFAAGEGDKYGTITAVDMAKTELRFLGSVATTATDVGSSQIGMYLYSTTQVRAQRNTTTDAAAVSWELTEWN